METEHYTNAELREAISILLSELDSYLPEGFHWRGNTEDWFVAAAMMACNIEEKNRGDAIRCIRQLTVETDHVEA